MTFVKFSRAPPFFLNSNVESLYCGGFFFNPKHLICQQSIIMYKLLCEYFVHEALWTKKSCDLYTGMD